MDQAEYKDNGIVTFSLDEKDILVKIGKALSSRERIDILLLLTEKSMTITEITAATGLPKSTVLFHCNVLEDAQLTESCFKPAKKGHIKLCSLAKSSIAVNFLVNRYSLPSQQLFEMPVGNYSYAKAYDYYHANAEGEITLRDMNDQNALFDPVRFESELFGFKKGFAEYVFPAPRKNVKQIILSMEICSEAPYYNNKWKSDITLWINGREIVTFLSYGDFGGRKGRYTPQKWSEDSTNYGALKTFTITGDGVAQDNSDFSGSTVIEDLALDSSDKLVLRIGIKEDALHVGGVNLFGKRFGDTDQAIIVKYVY